MVEKVREVAIERRILLVEGIVSIQGSEVGAWWIVQETEGGQYD